MSQRWSYKVVALKPQFFGTKAEPIEATLASLGQQGWELVSVTHVGVQVMLYLKKEI